MDNLKKVFAVFVCFLYCRFRCRGSKPYIRALGAHVASNA